MVVEHGLEICADEIVGLGRITENTPKHQGVVIYTMSDIPIGFGITSRSTAECRHADPLANIAFHQADIGEYIRSEDTLM
ncbi:60S ribosome subunit biogenesis protein NIP7-like [Papilio machaon]|uniref:60S ribosome subunit biogenesis protein NIP7-like n=1 Tax=Papilio machaon TaxID=76193 RepID=A0A194RJB6_PAPMA|nr:60S ribosome subunit biogenesis protein NIP7-like [Papilio machaon]